MTLKTAVASGAARRFVVGDPEILKLDVIAGTTIVRTAVAEHHAQKGNILLDEISVNLLGNSLRIKEWCSDEETKERFAVVSRPDSSASTIWQSGLQPSLSTFLRMPRPDKLVPWMHYAVFEREQYGQGTFLTEFRPCVALFVRFTGIDYESDTAEAELAGFICQARRLWHARVAHSCS